MIFSFKRDRLQGTKQDIADRYFDCDSREMRAEGLLDVEKWLARRIDSVLFEDKSIRKVADLTGAAADGVVNQKKRNRNSKKGEAENSSAEVISIDDESEQEQTLMQPEADDDKRQHRKPRQETMLKFTQQQLLQQQEQLKEQ